MVADDLRRLGVGRQLMERFEEWARSRDARLIALATRRAAPFYRSEDWRLGIGDRGSETGQCESPIPNLQSPIPCPLLSPSTVVGSLYPAG